MAKRPTLGFIGAGRAANAIAPALMMAGYRVAAVASRAPAAAERLAARLKGCTAASAQDTADAAELILLTTPDAVIARVAEAIRWRPGQAVVHCSGGLTLTPLAVAAQSGAITGSWHPLQTFAGNDPPDALHSVTIGIEASAPLYDILAEMARRVGGVPLAVPAAARPLYHAAAVMSCSYLVTLLHDAASLWERAGLPREAASPALGRLAEATLANMRSKGAHGSLTGPTVRGDAATIRLHVHGLASAAPELLGVYRALGRRTAALADATGWEEVFAEGSLPG